jgi:hypothetical protein
MDRVNLSRVRLLPEGLMKAEAITTVEARCHP